MLSSLLGSSGGGAGTSNASPRPPPSPPPPPLLYPQTMFDRAVLPFVQRVTRLKGSDNFSLLELGSWSGLYALELSTRYPRSTLVAIEPNRTIWAKHATLARSQRRANVVFAHNVAGEDVAEALSHANEFLDGQLLLSLQTTKPFDHGVSVNTEKLAKLDLFLGHLLSLARRSLLLLPAASSSAECRDNRLASWAHAPSEGVPPSGAIAARLVRAGRALNMRVHAEMRFRGLAPDGCEYELWEATLLHMDRVNRHHFCLGGCKTHTRRTYRMIYTAEPPPSGEGAEAAPPALVRGVMNMTNTQTGRHIPFETGSLNMHSILSLQSSEEAGATVAAAAAVRQALILMFLSLPVFQDPAPWNVVWRAGELFPIDVGDGTTLEERGGNWETFAQKYIGSLNECYRMSLKSLCALASGEGLHGDERYEACMNSHFGSSFCPSNAPFPCLHGCNRSYQSCTHLPPRSVVPGYFARTNAHVRGKMAARFSQFTGATGPDDAPGDDGLIGAANERFGASELLLRAQEEQALTRRADAARRIARPKTPLKARSGGAKADALRTSPPSSSPRAHAEPSPPRRVVDAPAASTTDGTAAAAADADGTRGRARSKFEPSHGGEAGGEAGAAGSEADAEAGLTQLRTLRGLPDEVRSGAAAESAAGGRSLSLGGNRLSPSTLLGGSDGADGHGHLAGALTLLQLVMVGFVGTQLCGRGRLLRALLGRGAGETSQDATLPPPRGGPAPPMRRGGSGAAAASARQRGVDSRLLGEL